ncbi:UNVERIFIED_ORG: signal transduction histidine kinase [Microbispora rosea subsp. rosea]
METPVVAVAFAPARDVAQRAVGRLPASLAVLDDLARRLAVALAAVRLATDHDLRPPALDELGLAGALEDLATDTADRAQVVVRARRAGLGE